MSVSILFVDDEQMILQGLKRALYSMRSEWKMHFAQSGREGLALLQEHDLDIVVSDMYMPEMDGADFLSLVQKEHSHVIRLILSGHSDHALLLRTIIPAHKFLHKPCSKDVLVQAVNRVLLARKFVQEPALRAQINQIGTLPTHPLFYPLAIEALSKDSCKEVSAILPFDVAMVANIMKVVMNSFAGDSKAPSTLEAAAQTLGVDIIKELVCRREDFAVYQDFLFPDYSILQLWRHSLRTARYAAAIAATQSSDALFVDQCYTAGLLHDVGKMVLLLKFGEEYVQNLKQAVQEEMQVREVESRAFNTTHEAAGAYLLCLWGLPLKTVEAVAFHSRPGCTRGPEFKPVTAVHVANVLDHYFLGFSARHSKRQLDQSFLEKNGFMERMPLWKKACAKVYAREVQEQKKLVF